MSVDGSLNKTTVKGGNVGVAASNRGAWALGHGPVLLPIDRASPCGQRVILVHGMLAGKRSMRRIANRLAEAGYRTLNWSYPTLTHSMLEHAENLSGVILDELKHRHVQRLHFVGHSMGCIVLRLALHRVTVPRGGRFVMLAPPNRGSRLTRLPVGPFASWFPQLAELSVDANSLVNRLPEPDGVEVGVIAAERDRIVDLDSTHLASQRDHCVVSSTHQRLPACERAIDRVEQFLTVGNFGRQSLTSPIRRAA